MEVTSFSQQTLGSTGAELLSKPRLQLPQAVNTSRLVVQARIDAFSPVNQNGSFEFDRVIKSGEVYRRTKKTKQWKKTYLVLRPNLLSAYKNPSEDRLHKQISLSDLNDVARLKDRKGRRDHLFSLYTPARTYHFQANERKDAEAWVELIRKEARIDEEEQDYRRHKLDPTNGVHEAQADPHRIEQERVGSSSPEPIDLAGQSTTTKDGIKIPGARRPSAQYLEFSGDDLGAYSDWSDTPQQNHAQTPHESLLNHKTLPASGFGLLASSSAPATTARNASHSSGFQIQDEERVVWHGYLLILRSKGAVRQWKKVWVVLRPKNLALYKNDEEYATRLILPLSNIINAVEIDPLSRSKSHCMQVIADDKTLRFSAPSEEALTEWLGALKSQLARHRQARKNPKR